MQEVHHKIFQVNDILRDLASMVKELDKVEGYRKASATKLSSALGSSWLNCCYCSSDLDI